MRFFYSENEPIEVTQSTLEHTPYTFQSNGSLYELDSIRFFFEKVPNASHVNVVDIGAQSGLYTLFAKYRPNTTFYAFEPFPTTFELLKDNIQLNKIHNVNVYDYALSDRNGFKTLNTCLSHNGLHTLGENLVRFSDTRPITVQTRTLDSLFFEKNIPCHFIKIDTEGWEYFILKGGEQTILSYRPLIQIEWNSENMRQCNVDSTIFLDYIQNKLQYSIDRIIGEEMFLVPK